MLPGRHTSTRQGLPVDSELAVRWMSENGSGSIRRVCERLEWLARTRDKQLTRNAAYRWIRNVRDLGFLEVDWERDRWVMTDPAIVSLPCAGELAFVTGARGPNLRTELERGNAVLHVVAHGASDWTFPLPPSLFLQVDCVDDLRDVAGRAGVRYVGCAAASIASLLPNIGPGADAAPPSYGEGSLEKLDSSGTGQFAPSRIVGDGLYRFRPGWRDRYLLRRGDRWYHTELNEGAFVEAARLDRSIISWMRSGTPEAHQGGTLRIRSKIAPPPLHARCLNFCSGLTAREDGSELVFDNVPRTIADRVASSLNQQLVAH